MRDGGGSVAKGGLCIPAVTPLDAAGHLSEADLLRLLGFLAPHASVLFVCGTTGEWNRISQADRLRILELGTVEGKALRARGARAEVWVGATAPTREETLALLARAAELGADAAVVAPLAIRDAHDPVRLFQRDIEGVFSRAGRSLPVYLYDNADIAVDPEVPHIRTRDVKALSRLEWVRGIKVSGSRAVLGNYAKAAANFRDDFVLFAGNAMLAFDLFLPRRGLWGRAVEAWNHYLLHARLPAGVVAGWANLAPALWAEAWKACRAGDAERMLSARARLAALSAASLFDDGKGGRAKRTIACLKEGLRIEGVVSCAAVAPGTKALTGAEAGEFARRYGGWKGQGAAAARVAGDAVSTVR